MVAEENRDKQASESLWLLSLSVDDVDRAVALISDPAGAPLILLRATGGDPADTKAGTGEWLWTDLFTQNAKNAADFYCALAVYQKEHIEVKQDHQYDVFKRNGHPRAGIVELRREDSVHILPY